MKFRMMTVAALATVGALAAEVKVDFDHVTGPIHAVHGTGQGPLLGYDDFSMFRYLKEAGIPYARLHDVAGAFGKNLFVDIPNVFRDFDADENDPKNYDFAFTDLYLGKLIENGVEPYFRLGVTIENAALRVHPERIAPPKDFAKWARICEHVIRHYTEGWADGYRWKITYWEVWNEADDYDPRNCMWSGTWEQFCELYDVTAKHLKKCFPHLKIGGYGKCSAHNVTYLLKGKREYEPRNEGSDWESNNDLVPESEQIIHDRFVAFCSYIREHKTPLDFFSFHGYIGPELVIPHADYHRKHLKAVGYGDAELHLGEWQCGVNGRRYGYQHDPKLAALHAAQLVAMQAAGLQIGQVYDAQCTLGNYSPLFDPLTLKPGKDFQGFKLFNTLYRLGSEAEVDLPGKVGADGLWVTAATGRDGAAVFVVNTADRSLCPGFDFGGRRIAECRRVDATHNGETVGWTDELPPHSVTLLTFSPLDGAKWIGDKGSRNPAFAKVFVPRGKVVSATLAVTGVGWYEAFLNGRKIGDKVLDPIPTQYDRRVLYSTYDVTDLLADGANEFRILLGNGLYNVQEKCEWGFDRAPWRADPAAIAVLSLRYADGTLKRIVTDGSWRVVPSPVLFSAFREGEVVLAEPRMDGASRAATVIAGPKGRLELESVPGSKVIRDVAVEKVETLADGSAVYRMAENMAGWARIRFTGLRKGDIVTIRYDERHPREGKRHIDQFCRSLPSTNACPELAPETAAFQTDRFVSAGGAEEFYEPRFTWNGFRYVTVKGAKPAAKDVVGRFVRTAFLKTGSFECDDAGFMKVMDATARSYESNFTDGYPTDCPHREKNGWLGDAALAIPYAALEWGSEANTLAYRNWIRTIADGQSDGGSISSIAPHSGFFHFNKAKACAGGPAWGVALTTIPTTLYRYRRDPEILSEAYPAMKKYVTKLLSERTAEGVFTASASGGLADWCAVSWDWEDRNFRTSIDFVISAFAYRSVAETAVAAEILGSGADAAVFKTEVESLRKAFNAKFYRGGGRYDKNASPTAQATALELGLVEPSKISTVRARLVEAVHEMDDKIDFGIIGSRTVFRQLCEAGAVDLAWKLIMRPDYPSYLNMVSQDVNTLMETFSGNCSHNHIMFGDVGAWAYAYLAGIQVGKGHARAGLAVTVRPFVPKALNHVKASVELVEGRMTVEWTKKNGIFTLLLDIPNGVSATIVMPDGKVRTAHARHQEWTCFL